MKSPVSSLSLVVVSSLVFGCGGGGDAPGADAGAVDAAGSDAAPMGPGPTLTYPAHAYTFLSPGTEIAPIVATATAEGTMTFGWEGDSPFLVDPETGTISGRVGEGYDFTPPSGTWEIVVTLTDEANRTVEWPIAFTFNETAETSHAVDIDTSCVYCAIPNPFLVPNVHVGDFIVFSTQDGGSAVIDVEGAGPIELDLSRSTARVGINGGAGTSLLFITYSEGGDMWGGSIQIVE